MGFGFHKLWDFMIKPALDCIEVKHIVEVGAAKGGNTSNIIDYCRSKGAVLTSIDPILSENVSELLESNRDIFTFYEKTSIFKKAFKIILKKLNSFSKIRICFRK